MKVKLNLENAMFNCIILYPVTHILLSIFVPDIVNKYAILFTFVIFAYLLKHTNRGEMVCLFLGLSAYILYTIYRGGIFLATRSDFYCFVLLALIFIVYSKKNVVRRYYEFMKTHEKLFLKSHWLIFALILYTIIFQEGLRRSYGSSVYVLHGPYDVSHVLGYILTAVYCMDAFYQKMTGKRVFFIFKVIIVLMIIGTAARSAVLGAAIMVFCDYLLNYTPTQKMKILGVAVVALLSIGLFTDILVNNPLIQKTLAAAKNGSITNGRERFSAIAMEYYYHHTNWIEKMFGIGMIDLRKIFLNNSTVGVSIHAHNEYVNMLVGYGVVGLVIYIGLQLKQSRVIIDHRMRVLLQLFIFVLAYFNGFGMYTSLTPCLISIYVFLNQKYYVSQE